jgi:regulatory protein
MSFGTPSLKGRALRYLSQREHSRAELMRKLAPFVEDSPEAPAAQQISGLLDELAAQNWQSESRVAESVLRTKGARFGTFRLKQTLQAKGLDPALIAATVQQARGTEFERALAVWRARFNGPPADPKDRARQQRFLAGRGFASEVIRRVVQGGDDEA